MKTLSNSLYTKNFEELAEFVKELVTLESTQGLDHPELKKEFLCKIQEYKESFTDKQPLQTLFFLEGIQERLAPQDSRETNLYLLPDQNQQIRMFNFMAEKFPLVQLSQSMVNNEFKRALDGSEQVLLIDIGMGTGQQVVSLLQSMQEEGRIPKSLTVIGIEPSQECLDKAQNTFNQLALKLGIQITLNPICKTVEDLAETDWQHIEELVQTTRKNAGKLIINASFALHHIKPIQLRDALLSKLQRFQPVLFALIEPYADFVTSNLLTRFENAWSHYGYTFKAIDEIEAPEGEKNAVKTMFFSREIIDVLSFDEKRVEQFETGSMWSNRFKKAGYEHASVETVTFDLPNLPHIKVNDQVDFISLDVEQQPIISILIRK